MKKTAIRLTLLLCFFLQPHGVFADRSSPLIIDHTCTDVHLIPESAMNRAKSMLHVAYEHTSHGSQIITGMNALRDFPQFGSKFEWGNVPDDDTILDLHDNAMPDGIDLSSGEYLWYEATRNYLNNSANADVNVIMWSWCNISPHDIAYYLDRMEALIEEYGEGSDSHPGPVQFIFMTGHANGGGEGDSSDSRNQMIRQHCISNNRILFDFADIENYDPDNNYFLDKGVDDALYYDSDNDGSKDSNWASEYLATHTDSELYQLVNGTTGYSGCAGCAHSPEGGETNDAKLNCVLKGRAIWWLWARLAGWDDPVDDPDSDGDGVPDDLDGCPNNGDKTEPGICGCDASDIDSDGDETADCNDQCPQDAGKIAPGQCGCGSPETDPCNNKPLAPVLIAPSNAASGISLSPTISAGEFHDPDNQDAHGSTIWQISAENTFTVLVCNEMTPNHLTSFTPSEPLNPDSTYYWRVRYIDNRGAQSEWSEVFSFTTREQDQIPDPPQDENGGDTNSETSGSTGCFIGITLQHVLVSGPNEGLETTAETTAIDPASPGHVKHQCSR